MPDYIPPKMWPPNSPDLNYPVGYGIWESLTQKVYKNKIKGINSLKKALWKAWKEFPQSEIKYHNFAKDVQKLKMLRESMLNNISKKIDVRYLKF